MCGIYGVLDPEKIHKEMMEADHEYREKRKYDRYKILCLYGHNSKEFKEFENKGGYYGFI